MDPGLSGHDGLFIGGRWAAPSSDAVLAVTSAATEEVIGTVPAGQAEDVDRAVAEARAAFDAGPWPRLDPAERGAALGRLAATLRAKAEVLASTIGHETGSPIAATREAQVLMAIRTLEHLAELAPEFAANEIGTGMLGPAVVRHRPVGVVGAIIAWNVPLNVTVRKLGLALLTGCAVVLKPAPGAPLSPRSLAEAAAEAGLPPGVLNVVPGARDAGEHLVTHPGVDQISFIGGEAAGRRVGALCGDRLKRVSLELGGKGTAIVLPDADLETVPPRLVQYGFLVNGQAFGAQSRILVPRERYADLADALVARAAALKVGDPLDERTQLGPLADAHRRSRFEEYVGIGKAEGAKVVLGGARPADRPRGFFVEPTVFADVDPGMRIAREEIFGPVLTVVPFGTVDQAVAIANGIRFGPAGSVWTSDVEAGYALAARIRAGVVNVNGFLPDNVTPLGVGKVPGIGWEPGPESVADFLDHQSVTLPPGAAARRP